jgi:hypothetical protein
VKLLLFISLIIVLVCLGIIIGAVLAGRKW